MATKHPLAIVKDKFGDKDKLIEAVKAFVGSDFWLPRVSSDRGRDRGLEQVSNAKLLRLHTIFTEVKEKFGTRAGLIDAILTIEKRTKDDGFKKRIEAYPVPRLYDLYKVGQKRTKPAPEAKPKAAPAAKVAPAAEKAAVKKAPAKKKPAAKA